MARSLRVRGLVVLAVVAATVGAVGVPAAGAAAPRAAHAAYSEEDCETLQDLSENTPDVSGGGLFGTDAAAVAEGFDTTAADISNKKLRKSMQRIADVYEDLGDAKNVAAAAVITLRAGKRYIKAIQVWTTATVECITSTVSIPSLPSGITLPRNITIPTIPR